MRVLGIDPGLATTGIGLVEGTAGSQNCQLVDWCTIETEKGLPLSTRLGEIAENLTHLLDDYKPDLVVIEKLYFATNRKTAIDVAQARGVILLTAEQTGREIVEPTPLQLKTAVTGDGKADKKQMQRMIELILAEKCPSDDAADALALAVFGLLTAKTIGVQ